MPNRETLQRATVINSVRITGKRADAPVAAISYRSDTKAVCAELLISVTEQRARAMLRSSLHGPVQRVSCEVCQQVLILRGRVHETIGANRRARSAELRTCHR
jgi:hypothetical protein